MVKCVRDLCVRLTGAAQGEELGFGRETFSCGVIRGFFAVEVR